MRILLVLFTSVFLFFSCSKKGDVIETPSTKDQAMNIYKEALQSMKEADYFYASTKFSEAESLLPQTDWAAKSSLMSSYCLYAINFYDDAVLNLERFIKIYPASSHIPYAYYLIAISYYEQILDERKDIQPLNISKKKVEDFLVKFPNTEYAIDLKFKHDLIINQLAAKELSIARYYIKNEKWIAAINRLRIIVDDYDKTIFVEEALHRLVEIYYKIGLEDEAKAAAALLGYNYNSSEWYARSYKVLNKDYEPIIVEKADKEGGLIKRTIKKLLFIDDE